MSLLSYSTQVWSINGPTNHYFHHDTRSRQWLEDLSKLIGPINPTEKRITSVLFQLSAAVSTGRALPDRIDPVRPYLLSKKLRELDPEALHFTHILEQGYSTYAVTEILTSMITHNLDILILSIESLVGIVNFDLDNVDENGKGKME